MSSLLGHSFFSQTKLNEDKMLEVCRGSTYSYRIRPLLAETTQCKEEIVKLNKIVNISFAKDLSTGEVS